MRHVYYNDSPAPTLPTKRWDVGEAKIALLEKSQLESALRKSRAALRGTHGMPEVNARMLEAQPVDIPEPDRSGPSRSSTASVAPAVETHALVDFGQVCHFEHGGMVHTGRLVGKSATHATVAARAGRFVVRLGELRHGVPFDAEAAKKDELR